MKDAPHPLSVQKGKPADMEVDIRMPVRDEDTESSSSSEEGTARDDDDDPDFAPEDGYTPLVEEAPAATSSTCTHSLFAIIADMPL